LAASTQKKLRKTESTPAAKTFPVFEALLRPVLSASGRTKQTFGVVHDIAMAATVLFISYASVFGVWQTLEIPYIHFRIALFGLTGGVIFLALALNRGAWRYASVFDLVAIAKASALLIFVYAVASFLYDRGAYLTRAQPVILFSLLVTGLGATRMVFRLAKEGRLDYIRQAMPSESRPILVYGMTKETDLLLRNLSQNRSAPIRVVGVIENSTRNLRTRVHGVKVIGCLDDMRTIVEKRKQSGVHIKELVVGDHSLSPSQLSTIVDSAASAGLAVSRLPDLTQTEQLGAKALEPRPINLADILGRPEVKLGTADVARLIKGKCILISGAGGSIGSEIARQVALLNPRKLVLADNSEHMLFIVSRQLDDLHPEIPIDIAVADVRDRVRTASLVSRTRPDVIFHAAALKHVPIVEHNPVEAIKTNLFGTKNIADAALHEPSVKSFVLISTDKAVNPRSMMGATKRAAEIYCQTMDLKSKSTRFATVRFGNVIGSNGSVVPAFEEQIAKGGPVTVTHPKMMRYFMSIPEAVRLVLHASASGPHGSNERGAVLVLNMGKPVKIADLAAKMIKLAGFQPGLDIEIRYMGLRPGEKLIEELSSERETVSEVADEGYTYVSARPADNRVLEETLSKMNSALLKGDDEATIQLLGRIVPEYRRWENSHDGRTPGAG
jgi:FlaA1/EpsC-like NDP-sugar epimerase